MFVITVDQVASRRGPDRVGPAIDELTAQFGAALDLPPDRTAGDEFQTVTRAPATALEVVLRLGRDGGWSIGLGIGEVDHPLASTSRASAGPAFVAARTAVEAARRSPEPRFALRGPEAPAAEDLESLVGLLLLLRARRSEQGWAVADLLSAGSSQTEAAARLGISPQAVSQRAIAAGLRIEQRCVPALTRLLGAADAALSEAAGRIPT